MGLGVPFPPRRQRPEAPALRWEVPVLAAVPGSLAAGTRRGRISSLCSRSNCSDGDLGQLPSLSRHGNESRRLKDKWLIKKQCCIAGFFIPPTAASAEAAPLALALPSPGEGAVRQPVPVGAKINHVLNNRPLPSNGPGRGVGRQRWARALGHRGFGKHLSSVRRDVPGQG